MGEKISAVKFYDNMADNYDQLAKDVGYLPEAVKVFEKYGNTHGEILDIGCGTGMLSSVLKGDFTFTGIEPSHGMARQAGDRGYQVIEKGMEEALEDMADLSFDYVIALGCLLYVKDVEPMLGHIRRIARKAFMITFDDLPQSYMDEFTCQVYNHYDVPVDDAIESRRIYAWQSPSLGTKIYCRLIYANSLAIKS